MRKSRVFSSVALILVAAPFTAHAADSASPELGSADSGLPDAVVVTATRLPTPEAQIASSVTVITADEIESKQERTLPDVLKDVPGLNLVQTGGPGGVTSVFLRGTNSNHTKVLVDGIDVSDPSTPTGIFDFGQFLAQDIERVEVLRGPQSGLYGSDAIGGVINIITKSGSGPAQLSASAEGGSFETFNQTASLTGSSDQFHYSANVEHLHAGATPVTPLDLLPPGEGHNDDYYDNLTTSTKLGFDVTKDFDLSLVARYTDAHLRDTGEDFSTFPSVPAAQQSRFATTEYYARASAHLVSFDGFLDESLGFAYTRKRSSDLEPEATEILDAGERTKVDWQGALKFSGAQSLLLGAEHARDTISDPISAGNSINSGYAELQSHFSERLYSAINARYDNNDLFGSKVTYRVAPAYLIPETGTKLKASVGSGFKAPTLSELFQSFPAFFFYANPNLKPESSIGYDLGVEQTLAGDHLRAGAIYFYNRIRNLIDTDPTGTTNANIGRAHTDGVESFIAYSPLNTLTFRADYTYTEATDDELNEELLRRPKHKASINAAWKATNALSVDATVLTVGSWVDASRDFSIPRLSAPGYTIVNIAGSFAITNNFSIFARVNNLFDRHYQEPIGFLQPSIGLFAGVRARL